MNARSLAAPLRAAVVAVAALIAGGAAWPADVRSGAGLDARGPAAVAGGLLVACGSAWLARRRSGPAARRGADPGTVEPDRASDAGADTPGGRTHAGLHRRGGGPPQAGSPEPSAPRTAVIELQILDQRCCLAVADSRDALQQVGNPVRALARPDRRLHDDDGYPLLTARIDALDAAEVRIGVDAAEETRRALAALERALSGGLPQTRVAAAPAATVVGLPARTPASDLDAAAAWARRRFGPETEVVATEAPGLWRLAAARCATAAGRPVLVAAAGSDIGPRSVAQLAADARLHGRDAPDGLVAGEGAVALVLRVPSALSTTGAPHAEPGAPVASLRIPAGDGAIADVRPGPEHAGAPVAAATAEATAAVRRALAASALTVDDLRGWFTDLQPQTPEAADLLSAMADLGCEAGPASLGIGACGTLGAVGSLAAVALAAFQARQRRGPTLALATGAPAMAFVVDAPAEQPKPAAGAAP